MDAEQMQAVRDLADFASAHAEDVYGDETPDAIENINYILDMVKVVESYLDGDQNETEDATLS